jgi:folate-dependent tRNA-U54 methylase TrmFO/GidA
VCLLITRFPQANDQVTGPQVNAIATSQTDQKHLYFYTACIPSAFLDSFDMASQFFPSGTLDITYYRIPLESTEMLTEVLENVLCAAYE